MDNSYRVMRLLVVAYSPKIDMRHYILTQCHFVSKLEMKLGKFTFFSLKRTKKAFVSDDVIQHENLFQFNLF